MGWPGHLHIRYLSRGDQTIAYDRHDGPLRVLRPLYPEGPTVCHHVLVHPPGGIVGGDTLDLRFDLERGAHVLLTTPGATRFYRSAGDQARQQLKARVAPGAKLEWLPLETIAFNGTRSVNEMSFELDEDAQMIGWDQLVLGLPASGEAFEHGRFEQCIDIPRRWLERGIIEAVEGVPRLLTSPLGWAGRRVLSTMWWACGLGMEASRPAAAAMGLVDALLDAAREEIAGLSPEGVVAGATSPSPGLVVIRALSDRTEPAHALLLALWRRWRRTAWDMDGPLPRIWRM